MTLFRVIFFEFYIVFGGIKSNGEMTACLKTAWLRPEILADLLYFLNIFA